MTATIVANGLKDFVAYFEALPEMAAEAAYLAVNDASRDTVPLLKRTMTKQVNFPKGYLSPERLSVRRKATKATLEAVISGRDRPTSLARFAAGATPQNTRRRPITVRVKANKDTRLDRAFLVQLKNNNIGLAIRLPAGQEPDRAYRPVQLTRRGGQAQNVWLLYGPSVDQVMQGVIPDVSDEISDMISKNFLRQFNRVTSRG